MSFNDIIGNARIKKILGKALQKQRIPNSLLFCGPEGVGKIDMALVIAKALNCHNQVDDACEHCPSCTAINKGNFPDVMHLTPDKDILKIDQIRILKEAAYLKPMIAKKRVFIVEQAERMNMEAANSLLKVLEEPPLFSHIILITANPFILLPTIKSRCQILNFASILREDIERCLKEHNYDQEKAKIMSLLVRGNLKHALDIAWDDVQEQRKTAWSLFVAMAAEENAADVLKAHSTLSRGQIGESIRQTLEIVVSFCRDILLLGEGGDSKLLMNPDYADDMRSFSEKMGPAHTIRLVANIESSLYAIQKNLNIKTVMSTMLLNAIGNETYV